MRDEQGLTRRIGLFAAALAFGGLVGVLVASPVMGEPLKDFTKDPGSLGLGAHVGLLSIAGVIVWATSGALGLFTATLGHGAAQDRALLRWVGGLFLAMAIDDAFQLHEGLATYLTRSRLAEYAVMAAYVATAALVLARFHERLRARWGSWLLAAGALFAASVLIDIESAPGEVFAPLDPYEDLPKWLGIVIAAAWVLRFSLATARAPSGSVEAEPHTVTGGTGSVGRRR